MSTSKSDRHVTCRTFGVVNLLTVSRTQEFYQHTSPYYRPCRHALQTTFEGRGVFSKLQITYEGELVRHHSGYGRAVVLFGIIITASRISGKLRIVILKLDPIPGSTVSSDNRHHIISRINQWIGQEAKVVVLDAKMGPYKATWKIREGQILAHA